MIKRTLTGAAITAAVYLVIAFSHIPAVGVLLLWGWMLEINQLYTVNYGLLILYGVLASAAGQFGDLSMSIVKRVCGVKDFGNLLPGHGGMLDRFDSHMLSVAFTLLFCQLTGGFLSAI